MENNISSMTDLVNDLSKVYTELRNKETTIEQANAVANVSSKLIKAAMSQLHYNTYLSKTDEIDFFKSPVNPEQQSEEKLLANSES